MKINIKHFGLLFLLVGALGLASCGDINHSALMEAEQDQIVSTGLNEQLSSIQARPEMQSFDSTRESRIAIMETLNSIGRCEDLLNGCLDDCDYNYYPETDAHVACYATCDADFVECMDSI